MLEIVKNRFGAFTKPVVFDIIGAKPGRTLLVTAGMDGDEYAGIAAAYKLIERYRDRSFAGRLIVIPIVNVAGFENETSWNPQDKRFPKFVAKGSPYGSPTQRLIHWLQTSYSYHADAWMDLHGGALTEELYPFLWFHHVGSDPINMFSETLMKKVSGPVVYENAGPFGRAAALAPHGCAYIVCESGDKPPVQNADVQRHVTWVEQAMAELTMIPTPNKKAGPPAVYRSVVYCKAPQSGIWVATPVQKKVKQHQLIGQIQSYDGGTIREIYAAATGITLWKKVGRRCVKGEVLLAVAT